MNDNISRRDTLDAVYLAIRQAIRNLPSTQPEIIYCKYCIHSKEWYGDKRLCFLWAEDGIGVFEHGFCNYAARRKDG